MFHLPRLQGLSFDSGVFSHVLLSISSSCCQKKGGEYLLMMVLLCLCANSVLLLITEFSCYHNCLFGVSLAVLAVLAGSTVLIFFKDFVV